MGKSTTNLINGDFLSLSAHSSNSSCFEVNLCMTAENLAHAPSDCAAREVEKIPHFVGYTSNYYSKSFKLHKSWFFHDSILVWNLGRTKGSKRYVDWALDNESYPRNGMILSQIKHMAGFKVIGLPSIIQVGWNHYHHYAYDDFRIETDYILLYWDTLNLRGRSEYEHCLSIQLGVS